MKQYRNNRRGGGGGDLSVRILEFGDKLRDSIVASVTVSLRSKGWLTEVKGFANVVGNEKGDLSEEKLGIMIYHGKTLQRDVEVSRDSSKERERERTCFCKGGIWEQVVWRASTSAFWLSSF